MTTQDETDAIEKRIVKAQPQCDARRPSGLEEKNLEACFLLEALELLPHEELASTMPLKNHMAATRSRSSKTSRCVPERLVHRLLDDKPRRATHSRAEGMPATRQERLRTALPATVALLLGCQAEKIQTGFIEDYVALRWLEWRGGGLRLTITGEKVCSQLAAADCA